MAMIPYVVSFVILASIINVAIASTHNKAGVTQTMNPWPYVIANPLHPNDTKLHPWFRGEFVEFYGPKIQSQYSHVFWQSQETLLPTNLVKRYNGSVMAVVGLEVDVVRVADNGTESSVTCFEQYNHHYTGHIYGRSVTFHDGPLTRDAPLPNFTFNSAGEYPTLQIFSEGNGNEHRRSLKAYPMGYAQLIDSPIGFVNNPMMINTNKRLTDDRSPGPIGGPLPKNSLAPANADYSGILECPCTDRIPKVLSSYEVRTDGTDGCGGGAMEVHTAAECTEAARITYLIGPQGNIEITSDTGTPSGCYATISDGKWSVFFNSNPGQHKIKGGLTSQFVGAAESADVNVSLTMDVSRGIVVITLTAQVSEVWFGVGFNATDMADEPYAIIVDGNGNPTERKLGNHAAGTLLPASISILGHNVSAGTRTVTLERPLKGKTVDHYTFIGAAQVIPFISAIGSTSTFSIHKSHSSASLPIVETGKPLNLCRDPNSNGGTIAGFQFRPNCAPFPVGELITTHNNICNITQYEHGLYCCHNGVILLDSDQKVPEPVDTFQLKYRLYYEDYTNQKNLFRAWWSTEAYDNEYDMPKSTYACLDPKTDPEKCMHVLRSNFTGLDMVAGGSACMATGTNNCANITRMQEDGGFKLIYAAAHCHAPACMHLELWDMDNSELVCRNDALYGTSYDAQDELGYVVGIPPCLWGSEEEGLHPPPTINLNGNYSTIKYGNNTNGHGGVMALWQMRVAYLD